MDFINLFKAVVVGLLVMGLIPVILALWLILVPMGILALVIAVTYVAMQMEKNNVKSPPEE